MKIIIALVVGAALGGIGVSIARDLAPRGDPAHCARVAEFARYAMLQRQIGMPMVLVTDQTPLWGPREELRPLVQRIALRAYAAPIAVNGGAQQTEFRNAVQVDCLQGRI